MEHTPKKYCIRCKGELKPIPEDKFIYPTIDEEEHKGSRAEYKCTKCGAYHSVFFPEDEESPEYLYEAPEHRQVFDRGYYGFCTECGSPVGWESDFMVSEVMPQEENLDNEKMVSYASCSNCGAFIEIIDGGVL